MRLFAHTLTFESFRRVVFDLADAHLTHAQREVLAPFVGDVGARLQVRGLPLWTFCVVSIPVLLSYSPMTLVLA